MGRVESPISRGYLTALTNAQLAALKRAVEAEEIGRAERGELEEEE